MSGKYRKKKTFQTILSKCLSQKYSMRSMPSSLKVNLYKKILAYMTLANFIFTLYNFKPLPYLQPFRLRFALTTNRLIPKITQVRQVLIFSSRTLSTHFETNRYMPVGVSYQNPLVPPVFTKIIYILLVISHRRKSSQYHWAGWDCFPRI